MSIKTQTAIYLSIVSAILGYNGTNIGVSLAAIVLAYPIIVAIEGVRNRGKSS